MKCLDFGLLAKRLVALILVLVTGTVFASEHGGGASGPEPMQFTVNIGNSASSMRVLQVTMVLEFASVEATHRLAEFKPKVQHRMILLLSSEEVGSLQTIKGKQELQGRIAKDLNDLLDETAETGIKDVFFTSFIIQ